MLNQSSLSRSLEAQAPVEAAEVHEAVCQYVNAYKKTSGLKLKPSKHLRPVCKWTAEETELFYEAQMKLSGLGIEAAHVQDIYVCIIIDLLFLHIYIICDSVRGLRIAGSQPLRHRSLLGADLLPQQECGADQDEVLQGAEEEPKAGARGLISRKWLPVLRRLRPRRSD